MEIKDFHHHLEGAPTTAGLHPWDTSADNADLIIDSLPKKMADKSTVALGEVGLDTLRGATIERQAQLLIKQLAMAEKAGIPVVLHIVRSWDRIIHIYDRLKPRQHWAIHGITANPRIVEQLSQRGIFMSVGRRTPDATIAAIPDELLLIETDNTPDAPPTLISDIATHAAQVRHIAIDELVGLTNNNYQRFFASR